MRGRRTNPVFSLLLLPCLAIVSGCDGGKTGFRLDGHHYRTDGLTQWSLPHGLREISGLALDSRQRLFGHGDEVAVIYQIDYAAGSIVKRFAFGDPAAAGDFEGIAWVGQRLYLVTSDGELLYGREGPDGAHMPFEQRDTGLGRQCEIEGLDYDAAGHRLLMVCKKVRHSEPAHQIVVLTWSLDTETPGPSLHVPWPADVHRLNPSGVTVSPATGHLLLVAARQHAVLDLAGDGTLTSAFALPHADHPQMEGIALTPAGHLIIADEGRGKRGRLSVYSPD